jgi:hypothetical protein
LKPTLIYIVICPVYAINNGDETYHIDSVWTSKRKAYKRRDDLNSKENEYGYSLFEVEQQFLSKRI